MFKRKPDVRKPGLRYEPCKKCGEQWNVSANAQIPSYGYLCPKCRLRRSMDRMEAEGRVITDKT
jgi:hypothetical protein